MAYYYCPDCDSFFEEGEMGTVYEQHPEVGCSEPLGCCPNCNGTDFTEADTCEFCGEPIEQGKKWCDTCEDELKATFDRAVEWLGGDNHARENLLEYIAYRV